jgi:hypothetical protein
MNEETVDTFDVTVPLPEEALRDLESWVQGKQHQLAHERSKPPGQRRGSDAGIAMALPSIGAVDAMDADTAARLKRTLVWAPRPPSTPPPVYPPCPAHAASSPWLCVVAACAVAAAAWVVVGCLMWVGLCFPSVISPFPVLPCTPPLY